MGQAEAYMIITALGMPFIFGYNAVCGVLRGMGESRRPLTFIIIAAVINVILDIILVAVFHMDAAGTAIATVLAQVGAFAASFAYMYRHKEQFDFELRLNYFKVDGEAMKIVLGQGLPQAIRSLFVRFSLLWVNSNINSYGLTASATNSVGNKIQKFLDVFTAGISDHLVRVAPLVVGGKETEQGFENSMVYIFLHPVYCSNTQFAVPDYAEGNLPDFHQRPGSTDAGRHLHAYSDLPFHLVRGDQLFPVHGYRKRICRHELHGWNFGWSGV